MKKLFLPLGISDLSYLMIYFASLFKSFRDDNEFIFLKETQAAEVEFGVEKGGEAHTIKVFLENTKTIVTKK